MRKRQEEGQAVILLVVAMGIFLLGAGGLAIDGSNVYGEREKAQTAADATAQAAMMSIFDGTNGNNVKVNGAGFTAADGGSLTCNNTYQTPCYYANQNGFSSANGDTIKLNFYNSSDTPTVGVTLSPKATDSVSVVTVLITHSVKTTLLRLFGDTATTVKATATAAIVTVQSPTPLLITDPTNANSLTGNGNPTITICGGPTQSVQVNSSSSTAYTGGVSLDLSHAGPLDTSGNCTTGTGANFGVFGGDATNPSSAVSLGTTGTYVSPESPILDPFAGVTAPSNPGVAAPAATSVANGVDGCTNSGGCTLYSPGLYTGGLSIGSSPSVILFKPGVYYLNGGGLTIKNATGGGANNSAMCVGCAADTNTGTGLLFYDTGPTSGGFAQTGGFDFDTGNNLWFIGPTLTTTNSKGQTVPASPYYGITLWEDRTAKAQSHTLGKGNGCFQVTGTIYITNTLAIMQADSAHDQSVSYAGNPCSSTTQLGDIVVADLNLSGNKAAITMNLLPYGFLNVRQVALVE